MLRLKIRRLREQGDLRRRASVARGGGGKGTARRRGRTAGTTAARQRLGDVVRHSTPLCSVRSPCGMPARFGEVQSPLVIRGKEEELDGPEVRAPFLASLRSRKAKPSDLCTDSQCSFSQIVYRWYIEQLLHSSKRSPTLLTSSTSSSLTSLPARQTSSSPNSPSHYPSSPSPPSAFSNPS